jgi:hypothetical protein
MFKNSFLQYCFLALGKRGSFAYRAWWLFFDCLNVEKIPILKTIAQKVLSVFFAQAVVW